MTLPAPHYSKVQEHKVFRKLETKEVVDLLALYNDCDCKITLEPDYIPGGTTPSGKYLNPRYFWTATIESTRLERKKED